MYLRSHDNNLYKYAQQLETHGMGNSFSHELKRLLFSDAMLSIKPIVEGFI